MGVDNKICGKSFWAASLIASQRFLLSQQIASRRVYSQARGVLSQLGQLGRLGEDDAIEEGEKMAAFEMEPKSQ